jgi:iron complex transport system substrate-binding protein
MKTLRTAAALLATTLALTGCSASGGDGGPTAAPDVQGGFPTTIDTAFGEVVIEDEPHRVVALGVGDADVALSLGVEPVGVTDAPGFGGEGTGPWADGLYAAPPVVLDGDDLDLDAIAALEPDLILDVRGSGDPARHDQLAGIAPTIGVPTGAEGGRTSPQQQTMMIAAALGVPQDGGALLTDLDAAFAEVAQAHPQWAGRTVSSAVRTEGGWDADVVGSARMQALARLGFVPTAQVAALVPQDDAAVVAVDDVAALDADVVLASPAGADAATVADDPAWRAVPAVADGAGVVVDGDLARAWDLGTPAAQRYVLAELTPLLETALG